MTGIIRDCCCFRPNESWIERELATAGNGSELMASTTLNEGEKMLHMTQHSTAWHGLASLQGIDAGGGSSGGGGGRRN